MSSIAKVKEYLARFGAAGRVMELDHSSATVELAAQALGVEGARIAKSLSFHMGEGCMIIVMAGDVKVDNARFKATFGFKAKMLTVDEALAMTGHAVGGVCPFALPEGVKVYLDVSLCHACASAGVAGRIPAPFCGGVSCLRQRQQRNRAYLRRACRVHPRQRMGKRYKASPRLTGG